MNLRALTALTQLQLLLLPSTHRVDEFAALPWLTAVCTGLPGLRKLGLGVYVAAAHSECVAALPQLTLHTLTVSLARQEDAPLLRELLGQLQHVRMLRVGGRTGIDANLYRAAAALPACHDVNIGSISQLGPLD